MNTTALAKVLSRVRELEQTLTTLIETEATAGGPAVLSGYLQEQAFVQLLALQRKAEAEGKRVLLLTFTLESAEAEMSDALAFFRSLVWRTDLVLRLGPRSLLLAMPGTPREMAAAVATRLGNAYQESHPQQRLRFMGEMLDWFGDLRAAVHTLQEAAELDALPE